MPEEPLDNEQQPSTTPHFDTFSGRNEVTSEQLTQTGPFVDDESVSKPLLQQVEAAPTVAQDQTANPMKINPVEPVSNPFSNSVTSQPETPIQTPSAFQDQPSAQTFAAAPVVPAPVVNPVDNNFTQPVASETKPSGLQSLLKNKKLVIGVILAVVVVLIGGASVLAVNAYQDPQKVITDGIMNAITAKTVVYEGSLSTDDPDSNTKATVEITARAADAVGSLSAKVSVEASGKKFSANGDAMVDKEGDIYFKVGGLKALADEFKTQLGVTDTYPNSVAAVDKFITRIDDKWIKISSKDLEKFSEDYAKTKTCVNDATKKFKDDKAAIAEVVDLYKKHEFIVVDEKLGEKDGSFGYKVKGDSKEAKLFAEGLNDTKIFKSINACDKDFTISSSYIGSDSKETMELWVSTWSHEITKIEAKSDSSESTKTIMTIKPKFNQTLEINAPKTSINLSDLQSYIEEVMTAIQTDMTAQYSYDL